MRSPKKEDIGLEEINNSLSAVIPCYNSSLVIEPTLQSLLSQELADRVSLEIIVIDNNCTDDTIEKVKNHYKKYRGPVKLLILKEPEPGTAFARKTGVLNASGAIISLIDDDNILNSDWVRKVCDLFESKPEVGAIGGYNEPLIQGRKPPWFDQFQATFACGKQGEKSSYATERTYLFGAGSSFRKKILLEIYQSQIPLFLCGKKTGSVTSGNDSELCLRTILMGWELWYEDSLRLKHLLPEERLTWEYVINRRQASGKAEAFLRLFRWLKRFPLQQSYSSFNAVIETYLKLYNQVISARGFSKKVNVPSEESKQYWFLRSLLITLLEFGPVEYFKIRDAVIGQFKDQIAEPAGKPAAVKPVIQKKPLREFFRKIKRKFPVRRFLKKVYRKLRN